MQVIVSALPYIQIVLAVLLTVAILIQHSDASTGAAFGGGDSATLHHTRRGPELVIFVATIVLAVLFVASSVAALLI
ncbi:MAG: preprotein translocase subunit SecG [Candidatus Pacebacteria bacterium]|nr:preprotein translocase subunit SecG [Candidatus Paceibacterota bacterium]